MPNKVGPTNLTASEIKVTRSCTTKPQICTTGPEYSADEYQSQFPEDLCPEGMVYIPAGDYYVGTTEDYVDDISSKLEVADQHPRVQIFQKSFCINQYEASIENLLQHTPDATIVENIPDEFSQQTNQPLAFITWKEAKDFCNARYRDSNGDLPTGIQWEIAASGIGNQDSYAIAHPVKECLTAEAAISKAVRKGFGRTATSTVEGDYCTEKLPENELKTQEKKSWLRKVFSLFLPEPKEIRFIPFLPNSYGIYALSGNVQEWVRDCYDPHAYQKLAEHSVEVDEAPSDCAMREARGGSWKQASGNYYDMMRIQTRFPRLADERSQLVGARCVAEPDHIIENLFLNERE